jgi:hypothetical protein
VNEEPNGEFKRCQAGREISNGKIMIQQFVPFAPVDILFHDRQFAITPRL